MPFAAPGQTIVTVGGRRQVVPSPGATGKTYAEFQAHIATLATSGVRAWTSDGNAPGAWRVTAAEPVGVMIATPWLDSYYFQSRIPRVIQHALPSEAAFNDQVANGRELFIRLSDAPERVDFVGVSRNGYTSGSFNDGTPYPSMNVAELIRWDGAQAWKSNPSIGGAETEYTW